MYFAQLVRSEFILENILVGLFHLIRITSEQIPSIGQNGEVFFVLSLLLDGFLGSHFAKFPWFLSLGVLNVSSTS